MSIFLGDFVTMISTLMVGMAAAYIVFAAIRHKQIEGWGRRVMVIALFGLVLCCFAATRDNYHLSVQASWDSTVAAGIFAIDSMQSALCSIGGAVIAFTAFSSIFLKNQKYRKVIFFIISTAIILKILIIEISRWMMLN